eukprot:s1543_g41.t1
MLRVPSYVDIQQKQLKGLLASLSKCKELSTAQAVAFLEGIDRSLWSDASVEELQLRVAGKTSQVEADGERRPMQDFSQIGQVLTDDLATMILEGKVTVDQILRAMCLHAGRMSVRVPSEFTIAVFVTLANWRQIEAGMSDSEKFLLLQQQMPVIRKLLLAMEGTGTAIAALPMAFGELPDNLRQAAFGVALPRNLGDTAVAMMQAARTMPLRMTNRAVSAASTMR